MKNPNHCAIIARVIVTPHPDPEVHSLAIGEVCGETVIVSIKTISHELGIYFPADLQISEIFAKSNDLIRRKDPDTGKPCGGMFDPNRRVRVQQFRGVKSYGFWAPLSYLEKCGVNTSTLKEGDLIDVIGKIPIASKYFVQSQSFASKSPQKSKRPKLLFIFPEHHDTPHAIRAGLNKLPAGKKTIIVTEKIEGTSQRCAFSYEIRPLKWYERLLSYITQIDIKVMKRLNGTRRVVLRDLSHGGYFPESWRNEVAQRIMPYLEPHMQVYFEVVGYSGPKTIAPKQTVNNSALKEKYGPIMTYTYGCPEGTYDIYVYRIAYVFENGEVDLPWDDVVEWCLAHKIKHVPEITRFVTGSQDITLEFLENLATGPSLIDNRHIREGICLRIDGSKWQCYKHKSFDYKELAGFNLDKDIMDQEDAS